ncbi:DNA-binding protein [Sulfurimonas sp. SWIR-19]|uniref:DNA-binding protein n=1 Tax=Sulfurimonas sp. SWIR-19 TaxID=2878390 RepID=UPI001CF5F3ED|nr:DNA-binding protein [Sulfurimonas sp. SWIR-19]UCN00378.1 DNA-binding protein [Sulfurimonas sp. SWIR-19]
MKKMSINDAAEYFGVSKEAIHNRVRRGSLQSVVENGVKMVLLDETQAKTGRKTVQPRRPTLNNDRYYKLLEEQNQKLQSRVDTLENETRSLRDQKEQMLIAEREKIERIYKEKDEQLKNILSTISSQFMLNAPQEAVDEEEMLEAEIESEIVEESKVVSLNRHLKKRGFSAKKIKKIKARFKKSAKKDERIIIVGKKYYIDTKKYDYSDIIG